MWFSRSRQPVGLSHKIKNGVKFQTLDQIEQMKDKAVRFVRDVVGDPERADELASSETTPFQRIGQNDLVGEICMSQRSGAKCGDRPWR